MDKDKCKVKKRTATKTRKVSVNMKISPDLSAWLKSNEYSPTGIFLEACKDLGYNDEDLEES